MEVLVGFVDVHQQPVSGVLIFAVLPEVTDTVVVTVVFGCIVDVRQQSVTSVIVVVVQLDVAGFSLAAVLAVLSDVADDVTDVVGVVFGRIVDVRQKIVPFPYPC